MKSKTHIYLANLVMEDLLKETIVVPGYGKFIVPDATKESILSNPGYFRGGMAGADFGHNIICPNFSDQILKIMLDEFAKISVYHKDYSKILSFLMGCVLHCCGELFDYSFICYWAGGSVTSIHSDLLTSPEKAAIFIRQLLITSYIDKKISKEKHSDINLPVDFLYECFLNTECMHRAPMQTFLPSPVILLAKLEKVLHDASQDMSLENGVLSYIEEWKCCVNSSIKSFFFMWNSILRINMEEGYTLFDVRKVVEEWLDHDLVIALGIQRYVRLVIKKLPGINEYITILTRLKQLLTETMIKYGSYFMKIAANLSVGRPDQIITAFSDMMEHPDRYLNNGILYRNKNITSMLDRQMRDYGLTRNTQKQGFKSFYHCINMCKLCLLSPEDRKLFIAKRRINRSIVHNQMGYSHLDTIAVTIETSSLLFSGSKDKLFFQIVTKSGRRYCKQISEFGNHNFKRGKSTTFNFKLPERIRYSDVLLYELKKECNKTDNIWKVKKVIIFDKTSNRQIVCDMVNAWVKKKSPYIKKLNLSEIEQCYPLPIDYSVVLMVRNSNFSSVYYKNKFIQELCDECCFLSQMDILNGKKYIFQYLAFQKLILILKFYFW